MQSDKWRLKRMYQVEDLEEEWHLMNGKKAIAVFFDQAAVGEHESVEDVVREALA